MEQLKKSQIRRLNGYSWSIIVAFIYATFTMQYHTANISFSGFFQVLPLIIIAVYWCERSKDSIKQPESSLKRSEIFNRDFFLLSFSFLLAGLFSLIFAYNNSDAKGWWILIMYFITLYGLLFSLIFSILALLIKNHKRYTQIFSLLIILLISFERFYPRHMSLPLIGDVETLFVITSLLLIIHCLLAIGYKAVRLVFNAK